MSLNTSTEHQDTSPPTIQPSEECHLKFNPDGTPRHFPGATIVCHLPPSSAIHRAIITHCYPITNDTSDTITKSSFTTNPLLRTHYALLPAPSLHMTLLDTIIYPSSNLPLSSPTRTRDLHTYRTGFLSPTTQSTLRANIPITMTLDLSSTRDARPSGTLMVPLKPVNDTEAQKLRNVRMVLADAFGKDGVTPDFPFHVTVYYPVAGMSQGEFEGVRKGFAEACARVAADVNTFEIGRVELCVFEDMCHFEVHEFV